MFFNAPVRHVLVGMLCLVPAAVSWWSGRSLVALLDDPVLPERLLAHRRRNRAVLWTVVVSAFILGAIDDLLWAAPLLVVSRMVAAYTLRRTLFDERWSFAAYMATMLRLMLAVAAFRLVLIGAPLIAHAARSLDWIVALALGALLLVWHSRSADVFRWLVRAEPLKDEALLARFRAISAASTASQPRFEVVSLRGGAIANALALPSLRGSSVVYSDTLLRLLDRDEAAAITAHEIAHLEHFEGGWLQKLNRIMSALILAATAIAFVPRLVPDVSMLLVGAVWTAACVFAFAWMVADRQRNETASDLRAVALAGDPEALVRALTKTYAFARLPRRWDTQMEQAATHPSLARRIRAIRGTAGAPQATALPQPEAVRSLDGHTVVTFEADRLQWQESEGVGHILSYAYLTELRVQAGTSGGARLVACERGGRRWEAALDPAEAARVQAILDRVDGRLAEPGPPKRAHGMSLLQAAGAVVAICAMWVGYIVVAAVAMAASFRSAAAFFAAAGGAAIGAAALAGRQAVALGDTHTMWPALLLAVMGFALLAGAWRRRDDEGNRVVNMGVAGLAVVTCGNLALVATNGLDAVRLYQASTAIPSAAVLPLALAAALACRPRRGWRLAAIPIGLVGLMVGIAGSGTFLYAFGRDPFLVSGPPLPISTLSGPPFADFTLPGVATDLRLSPRGRQVALTKYSAAMTVAGAVTNFSVGAPGSSFASIAASDLVFLDDDRVLTIAAEGTGTRVREVVLSPRAVSWEYFIDESLLMPRLSYQRAKHRWLVTGASADGRIVSVEGTFGREEVVRREWAITDRQGPADAWAIEGDTVLLAHRSFDVDTLPDSPWGLAMMALLDQSETRLTRFTPAGPADVATSQLDTTCSDRALGGERIVCTVFDGTRTHLLVLDPHGSGPRSIGSLAGHFAGYRPAREGWLTGWTTSGGWLTPTQLAVDVASGRAIIVPRELGAQEIAVAGRVAGTVQHEGASTRVRLYRVDR